jgi:hypothetical protein
MTPKIKKRTLALGYTFLTLQVCIFVYRILADGPSFSVFVTHILFTVSVSIYLVDVHLKK